MTHLRCLQFTGRQFIGAERPPGRTQTWLNLNSGIPEMGSVAASVRRLALSSSGKWNGRNTVSGRMSVLSSARQEHLAAPVGNRDDVAVGDALRGGGRRMDLQPRFRLGRGQRGHPPGLRAGLVVLHAAGR